MKRLKKGLIIILIIVLSFYLIVFVGKKFIFKEPFSSKPTIEIIGKGNFTFGAAAKEQPKNMGEYVKVLSKQIKSYNENFDTYWPENPSKNQYILAKSIDEKDAYLLSPNGDIEKITNDEFKKYNVLTSNSNGQWMPFNYNGHSGAYINVVPNALLNYYTFQKYEHLGTYDQFLSYSHELFHSITQKDWATNDLKNNNGDQRLEDTTARRTRMLLIQQLKEAIANPDEMEQHTKEAVGTYQKYRNESKEDYDNALLPDRIEGTAFYYELISSLFAGYPDEIKSKEDCFKALELLLADDNPAYRAAGLNAESYYVGGFAGVLLDKLAEKNNEDPNNWKKEIEQNGDINPMLLLEKKVGDNLPEPKAIPDEKEYEKWIEEHQEIAPISSRTANIFNVLYNLMY